MTKEIKAQILHTTQTANGQLTHGIQYDFGTGKSNIICIPCQNRNKLTANKTLKQHARHVLKEHSEILKPQSASLQKTA